MESLLLSKIDSGRYLWYTLKPSREVDSPPMELRRLHQSTYDNVNCMSERFRWNSLINAGPRRTKGRNSGSVFF